MLQSFRYTNINRRSKNEDRYAIRKFVTVSGEEVTVVAVADGMGGISDGAAHAELAVKYLLDYVSDVIADVEFLCTAPGSLVDTYPALIGRFDETIDGAADTINKRVIDYFGSEDGGTTLCAGIFVKDTVFCINVGDSPIYYLKPGEQFVELSVRDNESETDFRDGIIKSRDSEQYKKQSNKLISFIGRYDEFMPHVKKIQLTDNAFLLFGSDGAFGDFTGPDAVQSVYEKHSEPQDFLGFIIRSASEVTADNQTAVLVVYNDDTVSDGKGKKRIWLKRGK